MTELADTTRWQGFTHKELHRLLNQGAGPTASADPSRRWAEIAAALTEVGEDLKTAIGRSGAGWSGRAAGAAYDRLSGLADWAQQTGTGASEMRVAVETQAEHLAKARAEMPLPEDVPPAQPDPTMAPALQVLGSQTDQEPVERAATAGQLKAFEVMAAYQRDTKANTGAMAAFSAPAELSGMSDIHRHRDGGISLTTPALSIGLGLVGGLLPHGPDAPSTSPSGGHGHHGGQHGGWGPPGGGAPDVERRPAVLPGVLTGSTRGDDWHDDRGRFGGRGESRFGWTSTGTGGLDLGTGPGSGTGLGSGLGSGSGTGSGVSTGTGSGSGTGQVSSTGGHRAGGAPSAGPGIGAGAAPGTVHSPDLQSAVASQMAAAAGTPAAATPGVAAGTGTGLSGGDAARGPMRRFGMDTIGSGQWFGDAPDSEAVGASPSRSRYSRDERVTEQVSIDGEQHNLPPNVIGE
jgi:hypothetical protein